MIIMHICLNIFPKKVQKLSLVLQINTFFFYIDITYFNYNSTSDNKKVHQLYVHVFAYK